MFCEQPAETAQVLDPNGQHREVPAGDGCRVGTWTYFARDGHVVGSLELAEDEAARIRLANPEPPRGRPIPPGFMLNVGNSGPVRIERDTEGNPTRVIEMETAPY